MTPETLAAWSLVGVYSAAVVYVIAFVVFALDLAKRSADAAPASARSSESLAASGSTAVLIEAPAAPPAVGGANRNARVGLALTAVGLAVHVAAIVLRGIAAERVPWANMFEFALTGTGIMVAVFVFANLWKDLRFLGAYVTGLTSLLLTLATINFYDAVGLVPLPPPLQSAWLVIHVFVAILGTGFFSLGAGLSVAQLIQSRREAGKFARLKVMATIPSSENLERLAYRVNVIGFMLWTFTLIFGAIWAERAWGRYWGWDTKEVWTFVIWVVFAGYIHARATRGWRGTPSAVLAIVGFAAVLFNFTVVNLFFKGLHAYSGL
jgi:cytochrome c-type biogenesis protein CcsB